MLKSRLLRQFTLIGVLLLGVSMSAGTSSAAQPTYAACGQRAESEENPFSNAECSNRVGEKQKGEFMMEFPFNSESVRLCVIPLSGTRTYVGPFCLLKGPPNIFEIDITFFSFPPIIGASKGSTKFTGTVNGNATEVVCQTSKLSGQPEVSSKLASGEMSDTSCSVSKPSGCSVKEPVVATFTGQAEVSSGKITNTLTGDGPATSKEFTQLLFSGAGCVIGSVKTIVTGSQTCSFDSTIESVKSEHEMICQESGSNLLIGKASVKFAGKSGFKATNKDDEAIVTQE